MAQKPTSDKVRSSPTTPAHQRETKGLDPKDVDWSGRRSGISCLECQVAFGGPLRGLCHKRLQPAASLEIDRFRIGKVGCPPGRFPVRISHSSILPGETLELLGTPDARMTSCFDLQAILRTGLPRQSNHFRCLAPGSLTPGSESRVKTFFRTRLRPFPASCIGRNRQSIVPDLVCRGSVARSPFLNFWSIRKTSDRKAAATRPLRKSFAWLASAGSPRMT